MIMHFQGVGGLFITIVESYLNGISRRIGHTRWRVVSSYCRHTFYISINLLNDRPMCTHMYKSHKLFHIQSNAMQKFSNPHVRD